mgnify:FL=1
MNQSKVESFIEVCMNTVLSFAVSYTAWPFVAALYGIPYVTTQALGITAIFTVLSIARGYVVRRWFNNGIHQASKSLAGRVVRWVR